MDNYVKQNTILTPNLNVLFSLILGQVTPALRHKIQSINSFEQVNANCDSILLLIILRMVMLNTNNHKYKPCGFYKTMKRDLNLKQENTQAKHATPGNSKA